MQRCVQESETQIAPFMLHPQSSMKQKVREEVSSFIMLVVTSVSTLRIVEMKVELR